MISLRWAVGSAAAAVLSLGGGCGSDDSVAPTRKELREHDLAFAKTDLAVTAEDEAQQPGEVTLTVRNDNPGAETLVLVELTSDGTAIAVDGCEKIEATRVVCLVAETIEPRSSVRQTIKILATTDVTLRAETFVNVSRHNTRAEDRTPDDNIVVVRVPAG